MFVDSADGPGPLVQAWLASTRRLAVVVGSAVALLSLLGEAPVRIASLRGAIAWGALLVLAQVGRWILPYALAAAEETDDVDDRAENSPSTDRASRKAPEPSLGRART